MFLRSSTGTPVSDAVKFNMADRVHRLSLTASNGQYRTESDENNTKLNAVREEYKRYKKRSPPPDFSDVIDFENPSTFSGRVREIDILKNLDESFECHNSGLLKATKWKVFEVISCPGFIFIANPFERGAQHYFVQRSLKNFPCKPNATNLVVHNDIILEDCQSFWDYW